MGVKAVKIAKCFIPFPQAVGVINPEWFGVKGALKPTLFHPFPWGILALEWGQRRSVVSLWTLCCGCDIASLQRAAETPFNSAGEMPQGFSYCCRMNSLPGDGSAQGSLKFIPISVQMLLSCPCSAWADGDQTQKSRCKTEWKLSNPMGMGAGKTRSCSYPVTILKYRPVPVPSLSNCTLQWVKWVYLCPCSSEFLLF